MNLSLRREPETVNNDEYITVRALAMLSTGIPLGLTRLVQDIYQQMTVGLSTWNDCDRALLGVGFIGFGLLMSYGGSIGGGSYRPESKHNGLLNLDGEGQMSQDPHMSSMYDSVTE